MLSLSLFIITENGEPLGKNSYFLLREWFRPSESMSECIAKTLILRTLLSLPVRTLTNDPRNEERIIRFDYDGNRIPFFPQNNGSEELFLITAGWLTTSIIRCHLHDKDIAIRSFLRSLPREQKILMICYL